MINKTTPTVINEAYGMSIGQIEVAIAYEDKNLGDVISKHATLGEAINITLDNPNLRARFTPEWLAACKAKRRAEGRALWNNS